MKSLDFLSVSLLAVLLFPLHVIAEIKIDSVDDPYNPNNDRRANGRFAFPVKGSCDQEKEKKIKEDIEIALKMAEGN